MSLIVTSKVELNSEHIRSSAKQISTENLPLRLGMVNA